ncbi:MAG: hypothetical protein Q8P17_00980 [bacterium]|nr:hypothetical protein [bacterium]
MTKEKTKRDWWQKGRGLDLWSIPHFLFGILTAALSSLAGMSLFSGLAITIGLAILWEVFEKIIRVRESIQNILIDILLPIVAYASTMAVLFANPLHPDELIVFAVAVLALYTFTNLSGWFAYRRRKRDFTY